MYANMIIYKLEGAIVRFEFEYKSDPWQKLPADNITCQR